MYYISLSPSIGTRCTQCFSSEAERDEFRRRVEGEFIRLSARASSIY